MVAAVLGEIIGDIDAAGIVLDPLLDVMDSTVNDKEQMSVRTSLRRINTFAEAMGILVLGSLTLTR